MYYKLEKSKSGIVVFFAKNNEILVDNVEVKREELLTYLNKLPSNTSNQYVFCFDKNLTFGGYIQNKIFIESLKVEMKSTQEFIY